MIMKMIWLLLLILYQNINSFVSFTIILIAILFINNMSYFIQKFQMFVYLQSTRFKIYEFLAFYTRFRILYNLELKSLFLINKIVEKNKGGLKLQKYV